MPAAVLLAAAPAIAAPDCACTSPVLQAGTFHASAAERSPYLFERVSTLALQLDDLFAQGQLDVLCLGGTWQSQIRNIALGNLDPALHVYQPAPRPQPGCEDACLDYPVDGDSTSIGTQVQQCSLTPVSGGIKCADFSPLEYRQCVSQICPSLWDDIAEHNPNCGYCLEDQTTFPSETSVQRVGRCASSYSPADASACRFGSAGTSDAVLISRFPFVETEYHAFDDADPSTQPGLLNRGVTYARIESAVGPVHLFCSSLATTESGMTSSAAETLNATQSQELLDYVAAKANGGIAIVLGNTGSGPALAASSVNAKWPANFAILETELFDALLGNLDDGSQPAPVATCTYDCDGAQAAYADHVLTSGGSAPVSWLPQHTVPVCHRRGGVFFTQNVVQTRDGPTLLSDHFGVRTDVCQDENVGTPVAGAVASLSDPADSTRRKTLLLLKDAAIDLTDVDPTVTGAMAYVGRDGAGSPLSLAMPAEGWTKSAKALDYRFKSQTGPVVSARLQHGKLVKLKAKGLGAYDLAAPQQNLAVLVDLGDELLCGMFGGTVKKDDGTKFVAGAAPAPASCPRLGPPD